MGSQRDFYSRVLAQSAVNVYVSTKYVWLPETGMLGWEAAPDVFCMVKVRLTNSKLILLSLKNAFIKYSRNIK